MDDDNGPYTFNAAVRMLRPRLVRVWSELGASGSALALLGGAAPNILNRYLDTRRRHDWSADPAELQLTRPTGGYKGIYNGLLGHTTALHPAVAEVDKHYCPGVKRVGKTWVLTPSSGMMGGLYHVYLGSNEAGEHQFVREYNAEDHTDALFQEIVDMGLFRSTAILPCGLILTDDVSSSRDQMHLVDWYTRHAVPIIWSGPGYLTSHPIDDYGDEADIPEHALECIDMYPYSSGFCEIIVRSTDHEEYFVDMPPGIPMPADTFASASTAPGPSTGSAAQTICILDKLEYP